MILKNVPEDILNKIIDFCDRNVDYISFQYKDMNILICHSRPEGTLIGFEKDDIINYDYISCCYPKQVAANFGLGDKILRYWYNGITTVGWWVSEEDGRNVCWFSEKDSLSDQYVFQIHKSDDGIII